MNTTFQTLPLVLLAAATLSACGGSSAEDNKVEEQSPSQVSVQVQELRAVPFSELIQVVGIVKAMEDIIISAEEGGTVAKWRYRRGEFVPRDSVIVLLKDDVSKASYEAALAQYRIAQITYEKQQEVFRDQGISELQLKGSEYSRDAALAQANLMKARWERTRLRTPVGGVLEDRFVDVAELAPPGAPVARIVQSGEVKVLITIPERFAGAIRRGAAVRFTVPSIGDEAFEGRVTFVGTTVSPDNRTLTAEAVARNPRRTLKPEMVARVQIVGTQARNAIVIPEEVVQRLDQNRVVVYVEEQSVAKERLVALGGRSSNRVEVVEGLNEGDRLIISGYQQLTDGQSVSVVAKRQQQ